MATEVSRCSEPQPAVGQFKTGCGRSAFRIAVTQRLPQADRRRRDRLKGSLDAFCMQKKCSVSSSTLKPRRS
jgi:hypothetical protein